MIDTMMHQLKSCISAIVSCNHVIVIYFCVDVREVCILLNLKISLPGAGTKLMPRLTNDNL